MSLPCSEPWGRFSVHSSKICSIVQGLHGAPTSFSCHPYPTSRSGVPFFFVYTEFLLFPNCAKILPLQGLQTSFPFNYTPPHFHIHISYDCNWSYYLKILISQELLSFKSCDETFPWNFQTLPFSNSLFDPGSSQSPAQSLFVNFSEDSSNFCLTHFFHFDFNLMHSKNTSIEFLYLWEIPFF